MVYITAAAVLDPKTKKKRLSDDGRPVLVSATHADQPEFSNAQFLCPDKDCMAQLVHMPQHIQTFKNPMTRYTYAATVPARFQRQAKGVEHDKNCTALARLKQSEELFAPFRERQRDEADGNDTIVILNDNIPRNNHIAITKIRQFQKAPPILRAFDDAGQGQTEQPKTDTKKKSEGINHASKLAEIIRMHYFEQQRLQTIIIRRGSSQMALSDYFRDSVVDFARELYGQSRKMNIDFERSAAVIFEPILIAKNGNSVFHKPRERTILGQCKISEKDGLTKVAILLHAENDETYKAVKAAIRSGTREFLVASHRCYVDRQDTEIKLEKRGEKDQDVHIHVHIGNPAQFCRWEAPSLFPFLTPMLRPPRPAIWGG